MQVFFALFSETESAFWGSEFLVYGHLNFRHFCKNYFFKIKNDKVAQVTRKITISGLEVYGKSFQYML